MRAGTSQEVILFVSKMRRHGVLAAKRPYIEAKTVLVHAVYMPKLMDSLSSSRVRALGPPPDHLHINSKCLRRAEVPIAISAAYLLVFRSCASAHRRDPDAFKDTTAAAGRLMTCADHVLAIS
jgi:hypothetical protein